MPAKFLLALLCAFALNPLHAAGETVSAPDEPPASLPAPESRSGVPEASSQQIFQMLLGETALQNRQLEVAARIYSDLAFQTRDPAVTKRAVELTGQAGQYGLGLALARQWQELEPDSPEANLALINFLTATGNVTDMDLPLGKLLAALPDRLADNFLNLNRTLAHHSDRRAVQTLMERLAEPYPNLPEAHYAVAQAAASAEQFETARARAQQAQKLKPDWIAPVLLEAQVILRANQKTGPDEAAALLSGYLRRFPETPEVRMVLARLFLTAKRYPEARAEFDRLLKNKPDDPDILYPIAMLALQEKDYDTARRLLTKLTTLSFADQNIVRYFLGILEEEAGAPQLARSHFEKVTGGPQYLFARARIAQQMANAGQVDEALAFIRATNVHAPQEKTRRIQIEAQLLREAGRYQEGYDLLTRALKTAPEEGDLLYDAAMSAEKAGKLNEMEQLLKKLIGLQPENAHAYNALGYSLADRNLRLAEAYELIDKAVRLAPEDPFIMDSMGWVLYRQGRLEEALMVLQNAYAIKADPEIAAHLGEVKWMLGRHEEAEALWQKAAAEAPDNETLQAAIRRFLP